MGSLNLYVPDTDRELVRPLCGDSDIYGLADNAHFVPLASWRLGPLLVVAVMTITQKTGGGDDRGDANVSRC